MIILKNEKFTLEDAEYTYLNFTYNIQVDIQQASGEVTPGQIRVNVFNVVRLYLDGVTDLKEHTDMLNAFIDEFIRTLNNIDDVSVKIDTITEHLEEAQTEITNYVANSTEHLET